jgi:hypothetical protein
VRMPRTASVFGPRRRAGGGATYPVLVIALRTEAIVLRLIPGRRFTTRATVEIETPAAAATLDIDMIAKDTAPKVFVKQITNYIWRNSANMIKYDRYSPFLL